MAPFLMMAPEQPDDADSPLRHVMMGPLVPQVDEFKRRFGVEVGTGYGMTEIGAPFASDGYDARQQPELRQAAFAAGRATRRRSSTSTTSRSVPTRSASSSCAHASRGSSTAATTACPRRRAAAWRNGWFHTGDAFTVDERRQLLLRRPHQGRDPPPRREHLVVRGRGAREPASRRRRVGGAGGAVGVLRGRGEGVRRPERRRRGHPRGAASSSSCRACPSSWCRATWSSSPSSRRPRARCGRGSSSCANAALNDATWDREAAGIRVE